MQGNGTAIAIAAWAALGMGMVAAGCGGASSGTAQDDVDPQATAGAGDMKGTTTSPSTTPSTPSAPSATGASPTATSTPTPTATTDVAPTATTPTAPTATSGSPDASPNTAQATTPAAPTTSATPGASAASSAPSTTPPPTAATTPSPGATAASPPPGATAAAPAPAAAVAPSLVTGTIIPLYTPPTDPSWVAVAAAKSAHPTVPVLAVINPANGPGAAASAAYTAGVAKLTAVGVKVIGYVHTSWGSRPTAELETEMGQWKSWYPGVTGIFFDEMASPSGKESYYAGLTAYAKGHGLDFTIGNPGRDSSASYVGTEDVILIYENSGLPATSDLGGWHTAYARTNFGVIPYNVQSLDSTFVQMARQYVGYIYVQSDELPNPWDSVPTYLTDLVGALG